MDDRFDIVAGIPDEQWVAKPMNAEGDIPPREILVLSKSEMLHALPRSDAAMPPSTVTVRMTVVSQTLNVRDAALVGKILRVLKQGESVTVEAAPIVVEQGASKVICHKVVDKNEYVAERSYDGKTIYLNPT